MPVDDRQPELIAFFLPLPEPVGIPHGNCIEFDEDIVIAGADPLPIYLTADTPPIPGRSADKVSTSIRIWQVKSKMVQMAEQWTAVSATVRAVMGSPPDTSRLDFDFETPITVAEAVTRLLEQTEKGITAAFDRCLTRVDSIIRAYGLATGHAVAPVTRQRMTDAIPYLTRHPLSQEWSAPSLFLLGHNEVRRYVPPMLDERTQEGMLSYLGSQLENDPVLSYLELSAEARRAFDREGDTRAAVIYAESSCEVLLDGVLKALFWEDGLNPSAAASFFASNLGLAKRIKSNKAYSPRLGGGDWTFDGQGPIAHWHSSVAALRNRCVHAGYRPSNDEALAASIAKGELAAFIADRLKQKQKQYPKTGSMFTNTVRTLPTWKSDRTEFSRWLSDVNSRLSKDL